MADDDGHAADADEGQVDAADADADDHQVAAEEAIDNRIGPRGKESFPGLAFAGAVPVPTIRPKAAIKAGQGLPN